MRSFKLFATLLPALALLVCTVANPANAIVNFTPPGDAPNGGNGFVSILDVINNGGIGDQDAARASLTNGGGTRLLATAPVINHVGNGDANPEGHFGDEILLPHGAVDNRSIIFRAPLLVQTAGLYTFNVASDDGFTLALDEGTTPFVTGSEYNGALDTYNGTANGAVTFFGGRGTADTGAAVFLTAGQHQIDLTFHDGCCGDDIELTAAAGQHGGFNSNFFLVGAKAEAAVGVVGDINVEVRYGSSGGDVAGALNIIDNDLGTGFFGTTSVINHKDPEAGVCCGGFDDGNMQTFPGDTGANDDNYVAQFTGNLNMPVENGFVRFHIQSDDGFQFSVEGGEWEILSSANSGATSVQNGGEDLNADFFTGNSDVRALLNLEEGLHAFKFTLFEGGGGSYATIWMGGDAGAPGAVLFGTIGPDGLILTQAATLQFGFVPEPTTALLGLMGLAGLATRRRRNAA